MRLKPEGPSHHGNVASPGWQPPTGLGPLATEEWHRLADQLRAEGRADALDGPALGLYCRAYHWYLRAQAMLTGPPGHCPACDPAGDTPTDQKRGPRCQGASHLETPYGEVIRTRLGRYMRSPYLDIARQAVREMTDALDQMALRGRHGRDRQRGRHGRDRQQPPAAQDPRGPLMGS